LFSDLRDLATLLRADCLRYDDVLLRYLGLFARKSTVFVGANSMGDTSQWEIHVWLSRNDINQLINGVFFDYRMRVKSDSVVTIQGVNASDAFANMFFLMIQVRCTYRIQARKM